MNCNQVLINGNVIINILELRFKKKYIYLLGVWFDADKPDMNTFFTPITQMFINSWNSGLNII